MINRRDTDGAGTGRASGRPAPDGKSVTGGVRLEADAGVMTRGQDAPGTACAVTPGGVPGCGTGPAGRIAFVARELASLGRELTGHARTTPGPDTDGDQL